MLSNLSDYVNICSVRVCRGQLPPVLNVVLQIVAETGNVVHYRVITRAHEQQNLPTLFPLLPLSEGKTGTLAAREMDRGNHQLGLQEVIWTLMFSACFKITLVSNQLWPITHSCMESFY